MIFITGASSGIGEATARAFAEKKQNLLLAARRLDRLEKLAKELGNEFGIEVNCYALDVSKRNQIEAFSKAAANHLSQVTVLVNNAGLAKGLDPIQDAKPEDWDTMIDTNLKGLLNINRTVLPYFIEKRDGHIIHLGSVASRWAYLKGNVYSATKRAVSALTEGMRIDLLGKGIRVTEICPGLVETEFSLVRLEDKERAKLVYQGLEVLTPKDVADAIVWCAERPKHVNIQEMVLYPTDQASANHVHRK